MSMDWIMKTDVNPTKPKGFNVLTRIVFVHAAASLAVLSSTLVHALSRANQPGALLAGLGIVIAVAGCLAMVGVARQRSLRALMVLRWLLWVTVVKVSLGLLHFSGAGPVAHDGSLRAILLNEAVLIPLAIYWSRPVHARYLASFIRS